MVDWMNLGDAPYHERLTFVWLVNGERGQLSPGFVIDGRDYGDADEARTAIREALERTGQRVKVGDFWPYRTVGQKRQLSRWLSWDEFKTFLGIYGPVYPWPRPTARTKGEAITRIASEWGKGPATPQAPLYDNLHFHCREELVKLFPPGEEQYDPVLGRKVRGYGLNLYTGEFEGDTENVLRVANGEKNDDIWPLRDELHFIESVEGQREYLFQEELYPRFDKPEIYPAYQSRTTKAEILRANYEMWCQLRRRRVYLLLDGEPVRLDLADDGTPAMAWRLDMTTGRIIATTQADAEAIADGYGRRVTEFTWIIAVVEQRRAVGLDSALGVDRSIAHAYTEATAETEDDRLHMLQFEIYEMWARKFMTEDGLDTEVGEWREN